METGNRSVLFLARASIRACEFPAPHELDPVERRSAVPALDEYRTAEARGAERRLPVQMAAVSGGAVAGVGFFPKISHLTPSDVQNSKWLIGN